MVAMHTQYTAELYEAILDELSDGAVTDVRIGAFWTAVVAECEGERRCGLSASMRPEIHYHDAEPDVRNAGELVGGSALAMAHLVKSERPMERALGAAAVNALLPRLESLWTDGNAVEILAERGAGMCVVMVGRFSFTTELRSRVGKLWVLEQNPQEDDLPADAAPDVIPQADVIGITSTTLMNDTFAGLMALKRADAQVMVLGPSTPLSQVMFDYGVELVSGAAVSNDPDEMQAVLRAVCQGGGFSQVKRYGVRLVTMEKPAS